jgi:dTDP-4-amino-4,6-dideoxygalactose transaminase
MKTIHFVDLQANHLSIKDELDFAISEVIRESNFVRGPHVEAFEEAYSTKLGVHHCVSCANGTDALYISMKALGIEPGDEVITTAHSWISTSETITQAGGRVVFCDTDPATFNIDPALIETKITPRTRGIIPVHLYGQSANMDEIMEIARRHRLWVVEDCAQAHFAKYKERLIGTMGDAATFSFYPGKNLGAMGDAGCLVTNRKDVAEHAMLFARHGGKGDHQIEGINSRMDGLQAAILNVKLEHLDGWTEQRQLAAQHYDTLLRDIPGLKVPTVAGDRSHVYHLYVIRVENRDALRAALQKDGVPTVLNYPKALPFYKAYEYLGHSFEDFPVAHRHQGEILSIPMYPGIPADVQQYIAGRIRHHLQVLS